MVKISNESIQRNELSALYDKHCDVYMYVRPHACKASAYSVVHVPDECGMLHIKYAYHGRGDFIFARLATTQTHAFLSVYD